MALVVGQPRPWQPEIVIDDAVQQRTKLHLDGGALQPDHAAAEQLGLQPDLVRGADHADGIGRIGADQHEVRIGRLDRADDRRVVRRRRRIGLVVDDLQSGLLRQHARAVHRVVRELRVRADHRQRLRLRVLRHRRGEEALGKALLRLRSAGRREGEVFRVLELGVHREAEQAEEGAVVLHDDRHRRRDHVGGVAADRPGPPCRRRAAWCRGPESSPGWTGRRSRPASPAGPAGRPWH